MTFFRSRKCIASQGQWCVSEIDRLSIDIIRDDPIYMADRDQVVVAKSIIPIALRIGNRNFRRKQNKSSSFTGRHKLIPGDRPISTKIGDSYREELEIVGKLFDTHASLLRAHNIISIECKKAKPIKIELWTSYRKVCFLFSRVIGRYFEQLFNGRQTIVRLLMIEH